MTTSPPDRHRPTPTENYRLDFLSYVSQFREDFTADTEITCNYLNRDEANWTSRMVTAGIRYRRNKPDAVPTNSPGWSGYGIEPPIRSESDRRPAGMVSGPGGKQPSIPKTPPPRSPIISDISNRPLATNNRPDPPPTPSSSPEPISDIAKLIDEIEPIVKSRIQLFLSATDDRLASLEGERPLVQFVCNQLSQSLTTSVRALAADICTNCEDVIVNLRIVHAKRTQAEHLERARDCCAQCQARRAAQFLTASTKLVEFGCHMADQWSKAAESAFVSERTDLLTARYLKDHATAGEDHKMQGAAGLAPSYRHE
jgi:hypothetical protein